MSGRWFTTCCFAVFAAATARADEVRWRHVATRGDGSVRTFYKPADSATLRAQRDAESESRPPRSEATGRTVTPNMTAVIRGETPANARADRGSLEREIGIECSRCTREYSIRGDPDGRIVVVVGLRSVAEWNALIARIRALQDLGSHAVIVRGSVP